VLLVGCGGWAAYFNLLPRNYTGGVTQDDRKKKKNRILDPPNLKIYQLQAPKSITRFFLCRVSLPTPIIHVPAIQNVFPQ